MAYAAGAVHCEMSRGLGSLASIATTAPLVGFFGTVLGTFNSFRGCAGSRSSCLAALAYYLSEAIVPTALGLFVAILASLCYHHLRTEMDWFDAEMQTTAIDLVSTSIDA
jgi:biopolymer transport protein TolQ